MKIRLTIAAAFVALSVLAAACSSVEITDPVPPSEQEVKLTLFNQVAMAAAVRKSFAIYPDFEKLLDMPKEPNIPELGNLPVFVSVFYKAAPMIWGVGLEGDTQERLLRATVQVMRHQDFAKYFLVDRERIAIKVDIIDTLERTDIKKDGAGTSIEPGIHGLMLQKGTQFFFQLPTDFITLGWEQVASGVTNRKLKMLEELAHQADLGSNGWRDYPVYRFKTVSFLQELPDYAPVKLYRGMPVVKKYSGQDIQDGAIRVGRYMLQNLDTAHRFRDRYDPFANEDAGFFYYNPTQHAGALWSLAVLFSYSRRLEIIDQTKPALLWLMQHIDVPLMEPEASQVKFFQNAKTSATAIALLALTEMPPVVIEELGRARVNRLAYYLTIVQDEDGSFFPTYYHKLFTWRPKKRPTELGALPILALAKYYSLNPNMDWLQAASLASRQEIERFHQTGKVEPWAASALAEMWKITGDDIYADNVEQMGEAVLSHQYTTKNRPYRDYTGGLDNFRPPRTLDAAVAAHTLFAAAKLARDRGAPNREMEDAVLRASAFLLNQQYNKQDTYYLPFPDELYGAIRRSPVDNEVWLDPLLHSVVALCEGFDVHAARVSDKLEQLKAEGKAPPGWKPLSPEEKAKLEQLKKSGAPKKK